ncbi:MAG: carboxypeptidase regulatory-like domain-containing protein [Deltaproteobacteria bacterium]|nr:carboxypeptidase regulatory-like domain-containing protein [Deltaproteobacteria bacterium]MCL5277073.1 carboxypeptidase regulatory-like domain-containing protein [Deltaproteobacteria bacterium]
MSGIQPAVAASVSGLVSDAYTGKPLSGAEVSVTSGNGAIQRSVSGADGAYTVRDITAGTSVIDIRCPGYEPVQKAVPLTGSEELGLDIQLVPVSVIEGKEFVVTSSRIGQRHLNKVGLSKPSTEYVIGGQEAKRIAAGIENPVQAVVTLPGVSEAGELSSYMYVLGGGADENTYYLDGIPLFDPTHLGGTTSVYNDDMVNVMQFYPGGYPSWYGNALRGILNVDYRNGNRDRYAGKVNLSLIDGSLLAEGPIKKDKASFIVTARRTYYDWLLKALKLANDTVIPSFYDVQAKLSYAPNDRLKIFADYILSGDNLSGYLKQSDQFNQPGYGNVYWLHRENILGIGLTYAPSGLLRYDQVIYGATDVNDASLIGSSSNIANTLIEQAGSRGTLNIYPSSWDDLSLGYEIEYAPVSASASLMSALIVGSAQNQTTNFSTRNQGQANLSLASIFRIYSGFLGNRFTIARRFFVMPSLRYDYFQLNHQATYSPRIEVGYQIDKRQTIKFVTGEYHQIPLAQIAMTTNLSLLPERSDHFLLTYEANSGDYYARADAFYLLDSDLIHTFVNPADIHFATPCKPVVTISSANSGRRMTYGGDIMIQRYVTGKWDGWISYTYLFTKQQDQPGGPWYFPQQDQRHTVNVVADYRPFPSWELSWRWSMHSGSPYTPITDTTVIPNPLSQCPDQPKTVVLPLQGYPDSARFPIYNRLDFKAEKSFFYGKSRLKVYLDIINMLYDQNVVGYFYNTDYTQRKAVYSLPIIPYVGLEYDFQ